MRRLLLLVALAGCSRVVTASTPAASTAQATTAPPAEIDAGAPSIAAAPATCVGPTDVDTIDDGNGVPSPTGSLELGDVEVIADDDKIAVSWTRTTHFLYGDSWRSPFFAMKTAGTSSGGAFRRVELPVLAYACALYGTAGVNTIERPFVSWGVVNNNSFEVFDDVPKLLHPANFPSDHSKPVTEVPTRKQSVDHFVASRNITFAVLGEDKCEPSCTCADSNHRAMGMWLRSLDAARPWAERVGLLYDRDDNLGAPAIAMGETGGIVAYRAKSKLHLAWLDADGKPLTKGAPVEFDSGDVGAPALAMAGTDAIVVWAHRASKDDPYRLQSMRLAYGAAPIAPTPIQTTGSAFAPAVRANATSVTVAWMEGDSGRRGEIHVARSLGGPSIIVSGDETNARDPELSGTPEHPAIVWQSFPENRRAGVIRVGRLDCSK